MSKDWARASMEVVGLVLSTPAKSKITASMSPVRSPVMSGAASPGVLSIRVPTLAAPVTADHCADRARP